MKKSIKTNLSNCARCGKSHKDIEFLKFKKKADDYTHWAMCPNTDEPILCVVMKMKDKK